MEFQFSVKLIVDENNINAPTSDQIRDAIDDALTTPYNDYFGIKEIIIKEIKMENWNEILNFWWKW